MSEIRTTETIEKINVTLSEPVVSLASTLGGSNFSRSRTTRSLGSCTPRELIAGAANASEASQSLIVRYDLQVPSSQASKFASQWKEFISRDNRVGLAILAARLITDQQNRQCQAIRPVVVASCAAIGFQVSSSRLTTGILTAWRAQSRERIDIELERSRDGGVALHFDAEGFHDGACTRTLDKLLLELRQRGVPCQLRLRQPKSRRPIGMRNGNSPRLRN